MNIIGYDTVVVKDEVVDNRTAENKNYAAVKGSKLGKPEGNPTYPQGNRMVQKYQNGAVVETVL